MSHLHLHLLATGLDINTGGVLLLQGGGVVMSVAAIDVSGRMGLLVREGRLAKRISISIIWRLQDDVQLFWLDEHAVELPQLHRRLDASLIETVANGMR